MTRIYKSTPKQKNSHFDLKWSKDFNNHIAKDILITNKHKKIFSVIIVTSYKLGWLLLIQTKYLTTIKCGKSYPRSPLAFNGI